MAKRQRRVRHWSFWRKAFWTRPAFLVVYAVCALATVPFAARAAVDAIGAEHALDSGRICAEGETGHCLERVTGQLHGPFSQRRTVNDEWSLHRGEHRVDGFEVGPRASSRLDAWGDAEMTALLYRGQVVVVETPDGHSITTTREGARGAVQAGCLTLIALGAAAGLGRYARKKARTIGGWWRVDGPAADPADLPVALVVMPPACCFVLMLFGAPWWGAVTAVVTPLLAGALAVWRPWRRPVRPRHARPAD